MAPVATRASADSPSPPSRLDLRNDVVFKLLFANSPDLLADLINAVRYDEPPVSVDQVLNPRIDSAELDGKSIVLDLLAHDDKGRIYNIEMQVRSYDDWPARSAYYLARTAIQPDTQGRGLCPAQTGDRDTPAGAQPVPGCRTERTGRLAL